MNNEENEILIYNNGKYEKEAIVAEKWMRLIYDNPISGAPLLFFARRKILSHLYGMYCRTSFSAQKIPQFIKDHDIDMAGCAKTYKNYSDFFSREKTNVKFPTEENKLGAPCEGVAFAYKEIDPEVLVAAKGENFSLAELFEDKALADAYKGGTMLRIRLTPTNYHRMHFFDDGKVVSSKFINGDLYSVSPLALRKVAQLFCRNKRAVILFSSKNFGDVAIVEVGATCVGSIVHCFKDGDAVRRGEQASYFLPGGSLVLFFFKPGAFVPDGNLLAETLKGYETKIQIGALLN